MSTETFRQEITSRFDTAWALAYPSHTVGYQNHEIIIPTNAPFLKCYIVEIDNKRASIGTTVKFRRHISLICVELYVPEKTGTKLINAMSSLVNSIFQDTNFILSDGDAVTCFEGKIKEGGVVNGFFMQTVIIRAWRDAALGVLT